jgi:hypothetical protein
VDQANYSITLLESSRIAARRHDDPGCLPTKLLWYREHTATRKAFAGSELGELATPVFEIPT